MIETGRVLMVNEDIAGSSLTANVSSGAATLTLEDPSAFDEDGGTLTILSVNGVSSHAYSGVDDVAGTLTISPVLAHAVVQGEEVRLSPLAVERYAMVALEDAPDAPIAARIPHALIKRMPAGIRDEADREAVSVVETSDGSWDVHDVLARGYARPGYAATDWSNEYGVPLLGGALGEDVPFGLFGAALITPDLFASHRGPTNTTFPSSGSGGIRLFGEGGDGVAPVEMTLTYPTKIHVSAHASVANDTGVDWNVRFYIAVRDVDTTTLYPGQQTTQWTNQGDKNAGRHRQVANQRQVFFDASPAAPRHLYWWWGFQASSPTARAAEVNHLKMTLRVSYAPDVATTAQPSREPAWTNDPALIAAYQALEGNDSLLEG